MKFTRDEVLRRYLPADADDHNDHNDDDNAGQPPEATSRIVNAFIHKCRCNHLRDDLYQACYLVTLQVVNRAIETENPSGYIATAMRHAMIDVLDAEDTIHIPATPQVKKLPRPVRLYDNHQGEESIAVAPDRPHLNGQLKELAEGLSAHGHGTTMPVGRWPDGSRDCQARESDALDDLRPPQTAAQIACEQHWTRNPSSRVDSRRLR